MGKYRPPSVGKIYVDAEGDVAGRLASKVAKLALLGYEVYVFNAEKSVITGKKRVVISEWRHKVLERGDWYKGPFYPKRPDRILKRIIRGMLPKNWRGRVAYSRIKVFVGFPEEFRKFNVIRFDDTKINERIKNSKRKIWFVTLKEISESLGYRRF